MLMGLNWLNSDSTGILAKVGLLTVVDEWNGLDSHVVKANASRIKKLIRYIHGH